MKTKIGWIGLGKMGFLMSRRLLNEGFPLTVYNRTKGKAEELNSKGAVIASSPANIMELSEVIVIMVSDDQATSEIFTGKNGLLSRGLSNKIVINMSTVSPGISKDMAALCQLQNNHYLDAPVSGSMKQAENGELVIMAGGDETIFIKAKPVLDILGKLSIRVGGIGAGNYAKLAVNTFLGIVTQGLSESVAFAMKNGIDASDFLNIINNGAMSNAYVKIKGEAILQNKYQAAFSLRHIVKDLRLASESGMDTPLGQTAYMTFLEAESEFGDEDIIAVFKDILRRK